MIMFQKKPLYPIISFDVNDHLGETVGYAMDGPIVVKTFRWRVLRFCRWFGFGWDWGFKPRRRKV